MVKPYEVVLPSIGNLTNNSDQLVSMYSKGSYDRINGKSNSILKNVVFVSFIFHTSM